MKSAAIWLILIFVSGVVLDVIVYARYGWEGTISYVVLTRALSYPILALAVGVLMGHLFFPQYPPGDRVADAVGLLLAAIAIAVICTGRAHLLPIAGMLLGIAIGYRFWPQPLPPPKSQVVPPDEPPQDNDHAL